MLNNQLTQQKRGQQQKRAKQQRAKHSRSSSKRGGSSTSSTKRSSTTAADTTTAFPGVVSPAGGALPKEIIATGFYSTNKQLDPNSYAGTYDSASGMYRFKDGDCISMRELQQLGVTVRPAQQGPRATAATSTTTTAAHATTCSTAQMEKYQAGRLAEMARYERGRYNTHRN